MIENNSEVAYLLKLAKEEDEWRARNKKPEFLDGTPIPTIEDLSIAFMDLSEKFDNYVKSTNEELLKAGMLLGYCMRNIRFTDDEKAGIQELCTKKINLPTYPKSMQDLISFIETLQEK